MSTQFRQLWPNAGVDDMTKPMVLVPRGGSNIVGLVDGEDTFVLDDTQRIQVSSLDLTAVAKSSPAGAAPTVVPGMRFYKLSSTKSHGLSGVTLHARQKGTKKVKATIQVVVLGEKIVKLAILPVRVRDSKNALVYHSKKPFDAKYLTAAMNAVWKPQANIRFDLVGSDPVTIDDEVEIAKLLGSKGKKEALPDQVTFAVFLPMFIKLRHPKAQFTMFLVNTLGVATEFTDGAGVRHTQIDENGVTVSEHAVAGIADKGRGLGDGERVMPHEAGHWLGAFRGMGDKWVRYDHPETDKNMLMSDGGGGLKIPVDRVPAYFNKNY
jgi:hypothetical protein